MVKRYSPEKIDSRNNMALKANIPADMVLMNGTFITMDPVLPKATALAIKGDKILWVGDLQEAYQWVGPETHFIDLKGGCGYPGFIDTHAHILYTAMTKNFLQLKDKDKESILAQVQLRAAETPKGDWIVGIGWEEHSWPSKCLPKASDLDQVVPDHPVMLFRADTHAVWVNSCALRSSAIDASTPNPYGGLIEKDQKGNPTGILIDRAIHLLNARPPHTLSEKKKFVLEMVQQALQKGLTMLHDPFIEEDDMEVYKTLSDEKLLDMRLYLMGVKGDFLAKGPQKLGPFLELRCLKFWMDGAFGSRGAALFSPYEDDPGNCGLLLWDKAELLAILKEAKTKGFQVAIHAIGDLANHVVLDLYQEVGVEGLRWRIEHAQLLAPEDIERFAQMEVIAAIQPLHATTDMAWFEERVGVERIKQGGFVWRSLVDSGAILAGGSDTPVVDDNPLWGIHAAITRQNLEGKPLGGWFAGQCLTREEALKMYTINAAYACFCENELGSLEPGKLADLTVLPMDILTCDVEALIDMPVLYTIVNGKIVYQRQ